MRAWAIIEAGGLHQVRDDSGRLHASYPTVAECRAYIAGVAEGVQSAGKLLTEGQDYLAITVSRLRDLVPTWPGAA